MTVRTGRRRYLASVALALAASVTGAWTYNPYDYRKGEIAHQWPQHGAWQVVLRSGGGDGSGTCVLATEAEAQAPTFFLMFIDDSQLLSVAWGDTNFTTAHLENSPFTDTYNDSDVTLKVGDWVFFHREMVRNIGTLDGLRFVIAPPHGLAWDEPNASDGPNAISSGQMLARIAKGSTLDFQDGPSYRRSISLAGFGAAVDDLYECLGKLAGP